MKVIHVNDLPSRIRRRYNKDNFVFYTMLASELHMTYGKLQEQIFLKKIEIKE